MELTPELQIWQGVAGDVLGILKAIVCGFGILFALVLGVNMLVNLFGHARSVGDTGGNTSRYRADKVDE